MVLTIAFLSWFFDLREKIEWKIVKQKVYFRVALNLRSILTLITYFIEMKDMEKMERKMEFGNYRDIMIARLEDLNEKDTIGIDEKGRSTLLNKNCEIDLEIRRRDLSEIETKYSRFFDPQIVSSLLEIENCLLDLQLHIINLRYPPFRYEGFEDMMIKSISQKFHSVIKEIYKWYKIGVEIYPPTSQGAYYASTD